MSWISGINRKSGSKGIKNVIVEDISNKNENSRGNGLLFAFVIGLTLMLALRDIGGISFNKYLFFVYATVFMCIANFETLIYMLCFMFPLLWGLPGTYILLAAVILYYVKTLTFQKEAIIFCMFFVILEVVAKTFYPDLDITEVVQYLCTIVLFFTLLYDHKEMDYRKAIELYFYGSAVLCLILMISTLATAPSNWLDLFAKGWFRFGDIQVSENSGMMLKVNSNTLAYYSVVGMACGLVLFRIRSKKIPRVLTVAITIIHFIAGGLSTSRSWMIVTVIMVLLMLFYSTKSLKAVFMTSLFLIVAVWGVIWYLEQNPSILDGFITRMTDNTMQTGGGRSDVFNEYWNAFSESFRYWIMGAGVTQYREVLGETGSIHNAFQQIIVCYGIPGAFVFFIGMIRPIFKMTKKELLYWIPFIVTFIFIQTIQFINPYALMFPYVISVFVLKYGALKKEQVYDM